MRLSVAHLIKKIRSKSLKMAFFAIELASIASGLLLLDKLLSSSINLLPEKLNLESQWKIALWRISYTGKREKTNRCEVEVLCSKFLSRVRYLFGTLPITNIVEALNTPIQERNIVCENCNTVKVSLGTQNGEIYLENGEGGLGFITKDVENIFGSNVGKDLRALLRGKGHNKTEIAYDFDRIQSLKIYTDRITTMCW